MDKDKMFMELVANVSSLCAKVEDVRERVAAIEAEVKDAPSRRFSTLTMTANVLLTAANYLRGGMVPAITGAR